MKNPGWSHHKPHFVMVDNMAAIPLSTMRKALGRPFVLFGLSVGQNYCNVNILESDAVTNKYSFEDVIDKLPLTSICVEKPTLFTDINTDEKLESVNNVLKQDVTKSCEDVAERLLQQYAKRYDVIDYLVLAETPHIEFDERPKDKVSIISALSRMVLFMYPSKNDLSGLRREDESFGDACFMIDEDGNKTMILEPDCDGCENESCEHRNNGHEDDDEE